MAAGGQDYDLVVIGGGINGAGIARDAALRGLSVLLLDAADFGGGTSSWSSRLIHGGLRYLEYGEISLVYESLHERRTLRRIAPHLVKPLRLTIPLYRGGQRAPWIVRLGLIAYDLLSWDKKLKHHRMLSRDELLARAPGISADGLRGGASYYDAQVTFAERLVIENVIAAAAAGADVRNYCAVTRIETGESGVRGVHFDDRSSGASVFAGARSIVNAAGPWVDDVLSHTGVPMPRLMGGTKGSHIVVAPFAGVGSDAYYVEAVDGRPVFIIPWNGQVLIGTTDIRYDGDPRDARASRDEIDYLLSSVNAVFPEASLAPADVRYAYAGVRPLPHVEKGPESSITRKHILHEHDGRTRGLVSIIGGKLTTYRNLAEQTVDLVQRILGIAQSPSDTASSPLPGGDVPADTHGLPPVSDDGRQRLTMVYGSRCQRLSALCAGDSSLARVLEPASGLLAAEVALAIREEFALHLTDIVHRRLMTGLGPDLGDGSAAAVAEVAAAELGWSADQRAAELAALMTWNERLRQPAG